jgi:phosphate/phosphite/phosphonate ABC transporter binding protein
MQIGVRQRLLFLIISGLFVTMSLIGTYRYFVGKRDILTNIRINAEQSCKLMSELATPYLLTSDFSGLHNMAQHFLDMPDAQDVMITDVSGKPVAHAGKPVLSGQSITIGPLPVSMGQTKLGAIRIVVYPADLDSRLKANAVSALIEHLFIFTILAVILSVSVSRTITRPVKELGNALKDVIDRKDFTRRVESVNNDEIGALANGVNYLIERLEQFIIEMNAIASRISDLNPKIMADSREVKKNAEVSAGAIVNVSTSVGEMSASIQSIAESAESLQSSAEETSSAILEMNASNQEVARHTGELTSSVEDVTTSVMKMITAIREVAGHVETLSTAAEQTSASAVQIEATVREVERTAKESSRLSQQVSREAKDIGVRSIQETMGAMERIKEVVSRYSSLVNRLGKRSEEIGTILGVIMEVTERTNLLALNASILAAQAGEHGKGFAVVAEEIKALADRTAGSAQDISKLITSVQKEAKEAVTAITESLDAVDVGVSRSQDAGRALEKILVSSGRSAEMATLIERAMTEQARGIKQVSEAIANVKQMMQQIATATQAQSKGTEMILNASEEMRDIGRRVKHAMAEQGRGGKQIVEAAENVTVRAVKIAAGTKEHRQANRQIQESIERIQNLPRENVKRMESMAATLKTLGEQADLLNQELVTMTVRRGSHGKTSGIVKMGVIPLESPAEMHRRFTPLTDYLSRSLGKRVELSISVDFDQTLKNLEDGTADLAFLTPTTYIEAKRRFGAVLLVKALRRGVPFTHAAIVTRQGSGIKRVEDIVGKRFAFGDLMSTSSYLIPLQMLADAGITLDDLKDHGFLGHHDDVARAVLAGEYDAGGLREYTAKKFEDRGLQIIKTSFDIPEFNICASKNINEDLMGQIKQSLIALNSTDKRHALLLSLIDQDYTGFVEAADSDYDVIRRAMERVPGTEGSRVRNIRGNHDMGS